MMASVSHTKLFLGLMFKIQIQNLELTSDTIYREIVAKKLSDL